MIIDVELKKYWTFPEPASFLLMIISSNTKPELKERKIIWSMSRYTSTWERLKTQTNRINLYSEFSFKIYWAEPFWRSSNDYTNPYLYQTVPFIQYCRDTLNHMQPAYELFLDISTSYQKLYIKHIISRSFILKLTHM